MITKTIAEIFRKIADILEIKGENVFRVRAYARAAQNIEGLTEDIQDIINEGRLQEIPGIGKDLSEKIKEMAANNGRLKFYEDLKKTIPEGLLELLNIPTVGPKHAKMFFEKLNIQSVSELKKAALGGELLTLEGVREKTVENVLKGITLYEMAKEQMNLSLAHSRAEGFISALKKIPYAQQVYACGSLRRQKEVIRDIDVLAVSRKPKELMLEFLRLPQVKSVSAQGDKKSSVITKEGLQVDLRVVDNDSLGAALVYFTGSKNFNIKLRRLAMKKGLKINEYGVWRQNTAKPIAAKTEDEVFKSLGLQFIPPELREDTGEVELALKNNLPVLITQKDIKGDFHAHSTYSDGHNSIREMAARAKDMGYDYINITDHSVSLKVARGMPEEELAGKKEEIEALNKKFKDFRVFYGAEVDIDSRGNLDYKDSVLRDFDIVVAAIHTGFKQSKASLTGRLVNACKNKNVDIIAHPTGKLWGTREAYQIDWDEFLKVSSDNGVVLEINSCPLRLDLNDAGVRLAKNKGLKLAIGSDSHSCVELGSIVFGVALARRGWLCKEDVINSLSAKEVLKLFKK